LTVQYISLFSSKYRGTELLGFRNPWALAVHQQRAHVVQILMHKMRISTNYTSKGEVNCLEFCISVLPTSSIKDIKQTPYITTTRHADSTRIPQIPHRKTLSSTLAYTMVSILILAVCAIAVGFMCRHKRQTSRASRSSAHEPSNQSLISSSLGIELLYLINIQITLNSPPQWQI
jgi:hypothetical protein